MKICCIFQDIRSPKFYALAGEAKYTQHHELDRLTLLSIKQVHGTRSECIKYIASLQKTNKAKEAYTMISNFDILSNVQIFNIFKEDKADIAGIYRNFYLRIYKPNGCNIKLNDPFDPQFIYLDDTKEGKYRMDLDAIDANTLMVMGMLKYAKSHENFLKMKGYFDDE